MDKLSKCVAIFVLLLSMTACKEKTVNQEEEIANNTTTSSSEKTKTLLDEEKVLKFLNNHIEEEYSSSNLIKLSEAYIGTTDEYDEWELYEQLLEIAEKNGYTLDMSKWEGTNAGLPFNLAFKIQKKAE